MTSVTNNEQLKTLAIETHSRQADEFAHSYTVHDPYLDCFNYSRHRLDALLERFLPPAAQPLALLDVGCGTGHHMQRYAKLGYRVYGVDGSEEMLGHARANNPSADIRRSDVDALPFPDGSFDVVIAIEVMRYLPDPRRAIAEMHRVLKPGGLALVTASPLILPASIRPGAKASLASSPLAKKTTSYSRKRSALAASTSSISPRKRTAALRAREAKGATRPIGTRRSSRTPRIVSPTTPVAPTTATLMIGPSHRSMNPSRSVSLRC